MLPPQSAPPDRQALASALRQPWAPRADRRPLRAAPLTRRYEIAWLGPSGVETATRVAPAAAPF